MPEIRKYVHKPTEVRAVRWDGDNLEQVMLLAGSDNAIWHVTEKNLYVKTSGGPVPVHHGEYVVKGAWDVYPISEDALYDSYDEVSGEVEGQLAFPGM